MDFDEFSPGIFQRLTVVHSAWVRRKGQVEWKLRRRPVRILTDTRRKDRQCDRPISEVSSL